jgi:hypothetical protein
LTRKYCPDGTVGTFLFVHVVIVLLCKKYRLVFSYEKSRSNQVEHFAKVI